MKKSVLFYKELTLAEVGKTGTHEIYIRLPNNFDYETFFGNNATENGSVLEVNFTAVDTTNSNEESVNLRFVYFRNSNQEKRIPSLGGLFKSHNVQEGDIVCIESQENNSQRSFYIHFYKKGEVTINPSSVFFMRTREETIEEPDRFFASKLLQQIFYGAPGTGKSKTIKDKTEEAEKDDRVFRTTFHPDSDYSTFVGCYKPRMKSTDKMYSAEELAVKLKEIKDSGVTYPCHKFAAQYWRSINDLPADTIRQILLACGFTDSMYQEVNKGVAIGQEYLNKEEDGKIVYSFTPQAFTNAYVKAWSTKEDVYLIVEEINRGNCAQIFGDLFQLLDRKGGRSEYPVDADSDLADYIGKELAGSTRDDFPKGVKEGTKLVLPENLYIWATMNTSDQSLFPIDSAFKRRWDWEYLPIGYKNSHWTIKIGEKEYNWTDFQRKVNEKIYGVDNSEDKQLGDFFVNADRTGNVISADTLLNKILFYLWNDVCKDDPDQIFRWIDDKKEEKSIKFSEFFATDKDTKLQGLMKFLEVPERGKPAVTGGSEEVEKPAEAEGEVTSAEEETTPTEEETR